MIGGDTTMAKARKIKPSIQIIVDQHGQTRRVDVKKRQEAARAAWVKRGSPKPGTPRSELPPKPEPPKRTIMDVEARAERVEAATADDQKATRRLFRATRKAENSAGSRASDGKLANPGTGFTILKLKQPPVGKLVDDGKISWEELKAADEIEYAFNAITSRLRVRGMVLERIDNKSPPPDAAIAAAAHAVARYQRYADHWSARAKSYGDPMLEIIVSVVIDQRPFRTVASEIGFGRQRIERAVIAGLRDYAARAEFVSPAQGQAWMHAAERVFGPEQPKLADAIRRARVEV